MKLFYPFLILALLPSGICNTIPYVTSFNYQIDMPAVDNLLKKEWPLLFGTPRYDPAMVDIVFKSQHPGDINARQHSLLISVLKENNTLIGFITYYQPDKNTGHIELLAIDSQYKGKGYGKELVNYVQTWCKRLGCKNIQLYVYSNNTKAIQFYRHLGFALKNTLPGYYLFSKQIS